MGIIHNLIHACNGILGSILGGEAVPRKKTGNLDNNVDENVDDASEDPIDNMNNQEYCDDDAEEADCTNDEAKQFAGYIDKANVEEYMKDLRQRAASGEAPAQTELGKHLLWGHIIPRDIDKSTQLFRQAAEQGDDVGQCLFGMAYVNGDGVPKDQNEAFKWLKKASDQNNALALKALGDYYATGTVVQQDYDEAAALWLKAAELGYCDAMSSLAFHYAEHIGDKQEATKWFFKACRYGNEMAAAVLMVTLNQDSLGGKQVNNSKSQKDASALDDEVIERLLGYVERANIEEYLHDLRQRADANDLTAQTELGGLLLEGTVIQSDVEEAMRLFASAANHGNAEAQWQLGRGYKYGAGVPENQEEAFKWFKKSAEQDYPPALNTLGNYVVHGVGTKQDFDEAARLWRKAADLGNSGGMFNLACHYANQVLDKREATKWFFKAYLHGLDLSASILKNALQGE